jgi:hypothetical protein
MSPLFFWRPALAETQLFQDNEGSSLPFNPNLPQPGGASMQFRFSRFLHILTAGFLMAWLPIPPDVLAQEHVVSQKDLRKDLAAAAQVRQDHLAKVEKFFSSDEARGALKSANLPYEKVQKGVASLNDEELARLAARTDQIQKDLAAGNLSDRDLIIILLAVAGLVLIIVAVR